MAHLGWIFGVVGYIGGILTALFGHVGKYSLDQASELKELIVEIRRSISDFENGRLPIPKVLALPNYGSDLESKLELIRWYSWIRNLRLVRLPPKKDVCEAAKLLTQLVPLNPQAPSIAKKIKDLLA
jgi:hypothetical protein